MESLQELTSERPYSLKGSYEVSYKAWYEFIGYCPWKLMASYELYNYVWTQDNTLYLLFQSTTKTWDFRHFRISVHDDEDEAIRVWIREHVANIWLV